MKRILVASLMIWASHSSAAIYKCDVNGVTLFSQQPCGDDAIAVEVRAPNIIDDPKSAPQSNDYIASAADINATEQALISAYNQISKPIRTLDADLSQFSSHADQVPPTNTGAIRLTEITKRLNERTTLARQQLDDALKQFDQALRNYGQSLSRHYLQQQASPTDISSRLTQWELWRDQLQRDLGKLEQQQSAAYQQWRDQRKEVEGFHSANHWLNAASAVRQALDLKFQTLKFREQKSLQAADSIINELKKLG